MAKLKGLKKLVGSLSKKDKAEIAKSMRDSSVVKMAGGGDATMKSGVVKLGMGGMPKAGVKKFGRGGGASAKSGVMKKRMGGVAKSGVKKLGRGGKLKK
tara:strand:- start:1240 stop:1536 length:297 start_codon:yes stop_codon:yes gene_type:complete